MGRLSKEAKEAKTFEAIRAVIWKSTQKFIKDNKYDVADPADTRSDKLKVFMPVLSQYYRDISSDCYIKPMLSLYELATGEKMSLAQFKTEHNKVAAVSPTLVWTRHCAVVPTTPNDNGHNYPNDKIVIMAFGEAKSGIMHDGSYGNSFSGKKSGVRPATSEELLTITNYQYATLLREFFVGVPA